LRDRHWRQQRLFKLIVRALERARITAECLVRKLQDFLESLEALLEWRQGHAQGMVLLLEPGGADAEEGAPFGQHVQGRHALEQDPRLAICDACDLDAE